MSSTSSRKISQFTRSATIPSGSLIPFVADSSNYTITVDDLNSFLGTTGSLTGDGAATAVPILDDQGVVKAIRGLEIGSGISGLISPENGISLSLNTSQDGVGTPLYLEDVSGRLDFASVIAGTGISVSRQANLITISATGSLPITKTIAVNSAADLPPVLNNKIILEPQTTYVLGNDVTVANAIVFSEGSSFVGQSFLAPVLTYTGTNSMFEAVNVSCMLAMLRVNCPAAEFFKCSATLEPNFHIANILDVMVGSCVRVATASGYASLNIVGLRIVSSETGIAVSGTTWRALVLRNSFFNTASPTFIGLDLGNSVSEKVHIAGTTFNGPLGAVGLKGSGDPSNNVSSGNIGFLETISFRGGMQPYAIGYAPESSFRWSVVSVDQSADSRPDTLVSFSGNLLVTPIAFAAVPVKVNANWSSISGSQFSLDITGRATYLSERPARLPIDVSLSFVAQGGGAIIVKAYIAINGAVVANTGVLAEISSSTQGTAACTWQHNFNQSDYIEVFVENTQNTTGIIVKQAVLRVN